MEAEDGSRKKIRKPYTITKSRESWTDEEHDLFLEALFLYDRNWKKIKDFVGSKTLIQIRSHAQKYFLKVQKNGTNAYVPPPRPKRKAVHAYPHKASKDGLFEEQTSMLHPSAMGCFTAAFTPWNDPFMFVTETARRGARDISWTGSSNRSLSSFEVPKQGSPGSLENGEVMYNAIDEELAPNLWQNLESSHMGKSLTNKLSVKRQFFSLQMEEGSNLLEHLNTFNKFVSEQLRLKVKIEEEDTALLLLASLPPSYNSVIMTLLYGKDTLKIEEVIAILLSNERREKLDYEESESKWLVVKPNEGRGRSRERSLLNRMNSQSSSRTNNLEHYYCYQMGHLKRDCFKCQKDIEDNMKKEKCSTSGSMIAGCSDSFDGDLLSVSRLSPALPDFNKVYSFIGSIFDPDSGRDLENLKYMDPINVETVLLLMRNLTINLSSPKFEPIVFKLKFSIEPTVRLVRLLITHSNI